MKLITLRIDEEEKVRLEQLAEANNVTLSRVLREGARLWFGDVRERVHRAKGMPATQLGVRRRKDGAALDKAVPPTPAQAERIARFRKALYDRGIASLREATTTDAPPAVLLAGAAEWLRLVSQVYAGHESSKVWDWFVGDYCRPFAEPERFEQLRRDLTVGLVSGVTLNPRVVVEALDEAFLWLLDDLEAHEVVRLGVLPRWQVLEEELS
jgi:hypothetical protein